MAHIFSSKTLALSAIALTAICALPGIASAQDCYDRTKSNQTGGAVLGALAGAALGGGVIAGHHDRGTGAVLGAVLGAAVGSSVGKETTHCGYRTETAAYDDRGYNDRDYDNSGYSDNRYDDRYNDNGYQQPRTVYRERVVIEQAPPPPPVYRERVVVVQQPVYRGYTERRVVETRTYRDSRDYRDPNCPPHHRHDDDDRYNGRSW